MTEDSPTEPSHEFPGRRLAVPLGGSLLVALVLVLAMVWRDNTRRAELEVIVESTAVGDTRYLAMPDGVFPEPPPQVAVLNGVPLFPVGDKRYDKSDLEMTRLARDEATALTIYQAPAKTKEGAGKETAAVYFLKIAPGEYIKVRPARE
jgi:hypothetical protein